MNQVSSKWTNVSIVMLLFGSLVGIYIAGMHRFGDRSESSIYFHEDSFASNLTFKIDSVTISISTNATSIAIRDGIDLQIKGRVKKRDVEHWVKNRKGWIDQFPYTPHYHEEVFYDADKLRYASDHVVEESRSNAKRMIAWAKQYNEDRILKPWVPNREHATTVETNQQFIEAHSFLKAFFENPLIMTEEFETIYRIVAEYIPDPNPIRLGWIYNNLRDYQTQIKPRLDQPGLPLAPYQLQKQDLLRRAITSQLTHNSYHIIAPNDDVVDPDLAQKIMERLLTEIDSDNMMVTQYSKSFLYPYYKRGFFISGKYEKQLKNGDPFLIP